MGAFYFKIENRRDILNIALARYIYTKRIINNGGLNISIAFNYLETMQMSRQQPEIVQLFGVKIVLCH